MRNVLLAALFAGTTLTAHAEPTTWNFTYTGFLEVIDGYDADWNPIHTEQFLPNKLFKGSFTGEDVNRDGVISRSEVSRLDFTATGYWLTVTDGSCHCSLDTFSYQLTGALDFSSTFSLGNDFESISGTVKTGDRIAEERAYFYGPFVERSKPNFVWTGQTRFEISPAPITSPVPEPASAAMAGMGLLVLAGLRARRKRR